MSTSDIMLVLQALVGIPAMFFLSSYEENSEKHPRHLWYAIILYIICGAFGIAYSITLEV